ncbi:MAG: flagellar hook assembly protein FlgD [Gammaproteobacteria bacterium]|nr:flagellar hook assembly protein FlgD [Gammaproteobacteria bacterium]
MADIDTSNKIFSQLGLTPTQDADSKPKDELGQAEFLELMTTQLQFQDPLKPVENGEFLGQMAQFGTVSGINDLNTSFNTMSASFQSNQALQASTLVGRRVMAPSEIAYLGASGSAEGAIELGQTAGNVLLLIHDASGQTVDRLELGMQQVGLVDFSWDGLDQNGNRFASGEYRISAELQHGTATSAGVTYSVVDVESVTLGVGGQGMTLTTTGLGDIDMSQIRKIL